MAHSEACSHCHNWHRVSLRHYKLTLQPAIPYPYNIYVTGFPYETINKTGLQIRHYFSIFPSGIWTWVCRGLIATWFCTSVLDHSATTAGLLARTLHISPGNGNLVFSLNNLFSGNQNLAEPGLSLKFRYSTLMKKFSHLRKEGIGLAATKNKMTSQNYKKSSQVV